MTQRPHKPSGFVATPRIEDVERALWRGHRVDPAELAAIERACVDITKGTNCPADVRQLAIVTLGRIDRLRRATSPQESNHTLANATGGTSPHGATASKQEGTNA